MKQITIDDKVFKLKDIKQLYPAVLVKTGHGNETTEMSLEWIDIESKGRVDIIGYGLFVRIGDDEKHSFIYESREELDSNISKLAEQLNN
jgi:hypothetical protein